MSMTSTSRWNGKRGRWLALAGILLAANSGYLAAAGDPWFFYFGNVLLHVLLGLGLVVPFLAWLWSRRHDAMVAASGLLLVAGGVFGALLLRGNTLDKRHILWTHIALSALGLIGMLLAHRQHRHRPLWKTAAAVALLGLLAIPAARTWGSLGPDPRDTIENRPAPVEMAAEAMGGADGPFFPSSVHTRNGDTVPSSVYLKSESCARAGCHPDVYDQWESSAHHFSSFNNQWYRKSIEYMQEVNGITPSKWCGGCHDPAILQSGMMDRPIEEVVHTEEAQAGLGCTACHMISAVRSTMGQGDYEITIPPLHDLATSDHPVLQWVHDFLVKVDPEPHRRTFIKPFFRGDDAAEYCSACHKVHLDVPVNNYRWLRGFNTYDNWQASGVSGFGARSFYYPPEPRNCLDCHMPRVASDDAANKDGYVASHRFAAANTALPIANQDEEQLEAVISFLTARQVTVDIFGMTEARAIEELERERAEQEGGSIATTFAVGEEQGMVIGAGGASDGEAVDILAPLDRIPATVRRGDSTRIDVVVRTRGVGHFFPSGTVDAFDCWLELRAEDEQGRVVFWSGMADEASPVEPGAHFYRSLMIDARGNPINKRNASSARAVVYVRLIPPGAADTVHFRLDIPDWVGDELTLTAKLNYRKFTWFNTNWAYAGVPDPEQEGAEFSAHFDDRDFVFTGDLSRVSGELKEIPQLPIVTMAEHSTTLRVIDRGETLPDMASPPIESTDRERWNDYGIGLLLQGNLRAAQHAFHQVTAIEPDYVDGWVNLARVGLAEGDLEGASANLERALELEPDLARAHFFVGLRDKALGDYPEALRRFRLVVEQYPKDRVVRNQIARVLFLQRDYAAAVAELDVVFSIDPEDLMGHYTAMLAHRGLGDLESSEHHQALYERFKADEASQILTGEYRERHPDDNNERQSVHEHTSVPLEEVAAFLAAAS